MRRLNPRELLIFFVSLSLLGGYLLNQFVIHPLRDNTVNNNRDRSKVLREISRNRSLIQKSADYQALHKSYLKVFGQQGSDQQEMTRAVVDIEKIAEGLGLKINTLSPRGVRDLEHFKVLTVSLDIESDLVPTLEFIHRLQQEPHFFEIAQMNFVKGLRSQTSEMRTQLELRKVLVLPRSGQGDS